MVDCATTGQAVRGAALRGVRRKERHLPTNGRDSPGETLNGGQFGAGFDLDLAR